MAPPRPPVSGATARHWENRWEGQWPAPALGAPRVSLRTEQAAICRVPRACHLASQLIGSKMDGAGLVPLGWPPWGELGLRPALWEGAREEEPHLGGTRGAEGGEPYGKLEFAPLATWVKGDEGVVGSDRRRRGLSTPCSVLAPWGHLNESVPRL